jgi:hypothetical protein
MTITAGTRLGTYHVVARAAETGPPVFDERRWGPPRRSRMRALPFPSATSSRRVSPDGKWVAAEAPDRRAMLYATAGGTPRQIPNLTPDDVVIRWTPDGRALYVYSSSFRPVSNCWIWRRAVERLGSRLPRPPLPAWVR